MMAFLPPYSPELNPDEQVWNHAKADAGKRPIKSKQEMEAVIVAAMKSIQEKADLIRSFFCLPNTLYAKNLL